MKDSYKEEALQLIEYNLKTKTFSLNYKAEQLLKSIDSPFAVISVAGMIRTGKSFLINRMLLNQTNGFAVASSNTPFTKGLWIWSKPIISYQEDGTSLNTFVIDTEGCGMDLDDDLNHDIKIFSIAILLSSLLIYNSTGVIDESSIHSLNFIMNLPKFIELNSNFNSGLNTSNDIDNISNHFPSFLWVLRDFTQVNDNKEYINPKDNMEKLLLNNNYTMNLLENENKNKVRKMIRSLFKDRDCFTLVKPSTNEKHQFNENIDQIRPQFLEQINNLKKKILTKIKPKIFKGKLLSGDMYVQIIKSLINAINSGNIFSINNTWISLCKSESNKAVEESEKIYESIVAEKFKYVLNNNQNFLSFHQDAKKRSIETFKKKSFGEISHENQKLLKKRLRDRFESYSKRIDDELRNNLTKLMESWFKLIEYKLNSKEIKFISELESEFKLIEHKVNENFSQFRLKNEIFLSYKLKSVTLAAEHFLKIGKVENLQLSNQVTELMAVLQKDKNSNVIKIDNELNKLKQANEQLKYENFDIIQQNNSLKENYSNLAKEKESLSFNLNEKIYILTQDLERISYDLGMKLSLCDEKRLTNEKKLLHEKNEIEREKSLLEQRIEQFTRKIEDQDKRSQENLKDFQSQIKEQTIANSFVINKYENHIKDLKKQIEEYKDNFLELESTFTNKEYLSEVKLSNLEETIMKLKIVNNDLDENNKLLTHKLEQQKIKYEDANRENESETQSKISTMKTLNEENEIKFRSLEDGYKSLIESNDRDIAILKQNIVFLESQLNDTNSQLKDQKQLNDELEEKLIDTTSKLEDELNNIKDMKKNFINEKKNLEENMEKMKNNFIKDIEALNLKLSEHSNKHRADSENRNNEFNEFKKNFDELKKEYDINLFKNKNLSESISKLNAEYQTKLKLLSREYEKRNDDKDLKHQYTLNEMNKSYEDTIVQLRALFNNDKKILEEKLIKERENFEFKTNLNIVDYESKLRVQESDFIEQMDNLSNELNNQINNNQLTESTLSHKINLLEQKIETLEEHLRESKENFNRYQENNNTNFDNHMEIVKKEREEFLNKIENLNFEISDKNREITTLNYKLQQLNSIISEKDDILSKLKKNYENEKRDLTERLDQLKQKIETSNDEFIAKKTELEREKALHSQQITFLDQKVEYLQTVIQANQQKYEDRLFSLRGEIERDYQERLDRVNQEKSDLETKLNNKKKEIKDVQNTLQKHIQISEKEKSSLNERLIISETKKKEIIENSEKEILILNNLLNNVKKDSSSLAANNQKEIESLRIKITGLEKELNEKRSLFEKEKMLFENKLKFLEGQKEQFKKEISDNHKKFETSLENIHKRSMLEKEKIDLAARNNVSALDLKYQLELKEINESHAKIYHDLHNTNKSLENDLVLIKNQSEGKDKWKEEINGLNRRINELSSINENLAREIENQKREREIKIHEATVFMDKERETFKLKISDLEKKLSEFELKKGRLILEFEREKSKFFSEKDHYDMKIREISELNEKNEKKIENLIKEIDKLKNNKNTQLVQSYFSNNLNSLHHSPKPNYLSNSNGISNQKSALKPSSINLNPHKDSESINNRKQDEDKILSSPSTQNKKERSNYTRSPINITVDENELDIQINEEDEKIKKPKNYSIKDYDDEEPKLVN